MMIESGALFVWYFHYMPVGHGAVTDLLPTPEQREEMYHRIRHFRETKPIFGMDFQNDGEYVGGCIAGAEDISISMQKVMWSPAYSSIIQMSISMTARSLRP